MGIVSDIREVATLAGYEFIYGTDEFVNADADNKDLQNSNLIYLAPVVESGTYVNGSIGVLSNSIIIGLGVKNDGAEQATTDEYYEQKYDRRLEDMAIELKAFMKTLSCHTNFTFTRSRVFEAINKFDVNLDVMLAEITTEYES